MPRQLRANLLIQFWSYISDALNFLGLLGCAGDDGASALPGAFRFWSRLPTLSPDIQWILMRSIVLERKTLNHQKYQTSAAGLDKISYYHLIHHLQNLLIQGQKCDPGHHIRRQYCQKNLIV